MRLKELKLKAGITQNELAQNIGVTGQTVLNRENGIYEPKINQLIALANIFNVSVDYLIERDTKNSAVNTPCEYLNSIPKEDFINFVRKSLEKQDLFRNKSNLLWVAFFNDYGAAKKI